VATAVLLEDELGQPAAEKEKEAVEKGKEHAGFVCISKCKVCSKQYTDGSGSEGGTKYRSTTRSPGGSRGVDGGHQAGQRARGIACDTCMDGDLAHSTEPPGSPALHEIGEVPNSAAGSFSVGEVINGAGALARFCSGQKVVCRLYSRSETRARPRRRQRARPAPAPSAGASI
jgi:hypothetical protein